MKFRGTLEHGAMPIPEGTQYQIFRETNLIQDKNFDTKNGVKAIVQQLRNIADTLEKYNNFGEFIVAQKGDWPNMNLTAKKTEELELINVHANIQLIEPPAAFFGDSEDFRWRLNTMIELEFE